MLAQQQMEQNSLHLSLTLLQKIERDGRCFTRRPWQLLMALHLPRKKQQTQPTTAPAALQTPALSIATCPA
jgi:hypothetical protein